ncbi:MAG: hypothetical protein V1692_01235 [bacterium]
MSNFQKSILATVAYFDIFDYPLTLAELWQWHYGFGSGGEASLAEIESVLADLPGLASFNGFYFLSGRQAIVSTRLARYNIAEDKFVWARRAVWLLSKLPFIRLVTICNTLSYSNARAESDIDLFVITAKNRIWTARLFSIFIFQFLGWRPSPGRQQNKICLSFFTAEDNLDLRVATRGDNDIYFHFWLATLLPLYDAGGYYDSLLKANSWLKGYLPNVLGVELSQRRKIKPCFSLAKKLLEYQPIFLEKIYAYLQFTFMGQKLKKMINQDTRVMVTNRILKFHPVDRREEYEQLWRRKIANLLF